MLIDWFTVGAQIVNFIVLVWLLKRFLYKPILSAIHVREQRIKDEFADAARQKAETDHAREDLSIKDKAFDSERAALLTQAVADAAREHDRLLSEARIEVDALRAKQQALLQNERQARNDQLTRMVTAEVFAIARRALQDLAGTALEDRMGEILARRLREMKAADKSSWNAALKGAGDAAIVRSRFDLPEHSKTIIQAAVNDSCQSDVPLRFETASAGICGIELIAQGQKLSWSIAEYLKSLEEKVDILLKSQKLLTGAVAVPSPSPVASVAQIVPRTAAS
jgi:F-type H+-transporting ATPase subunit b